MAVLVMLSLVLGIAASLAAGAYSGVRIGGEALGGGAGLVTLLLIGRAHA